MQLYNKFIKLLLIPLIVFSIVTNLYSQDTVLVTIQQPPPNQLRIEHLWKIILNNISYDTLDVYLYATLTEQNDGLIATATTSSINLKPGIKNITVNELEPISFSYPSPYPKYQQYVIRTGGFPSGEYDLCVYVRYTGTYNNCGSDCIQQTVEIIPAPTLISPIDGEEINTRPIFTWLHAVSPGTNVKYKIRIVEIKENQSPEIAMQINPIWFEEKDIMTKVFRYPLSAEEFLDSCEYAWQITSFDQFGYPIGENNGLSEIGSYNFIRIPIYKAINIFAEIKFFDIEKSVNTEWAKIGDELTYTFYIKRNDETLKPDKIQIQDAIPAGTELVIPEGGELKDAVTIKQITESGEERPYNKKDNCEVNAAGGNLTISINSFPRQNSLKITFKVKIVYRPEGGVVNNKVVKIIIPEFEIPHGTAGPFEGEFEEGTETTVPPNISISKISKVYDEETNKCGPGDYITYTITITNNENEEVNVPIYDLIPNNVQSDPPCILKVNGEEIKYEIVEHTDWNRYFHYTITIPPNATIIITLSCKVIDYGIIENKIYTFKLPKNSDVKPDAENTIESNEETYLRNTYKREYANIIKHKNLANSICNIDAVLDLILNGHIEFEHDCNGTPVKINLTFEGYGSTPSISDTGVHGKTNFDIHYDPGEFVFHIKTSIKYITILKYDFWLENKAVFYHELLHIQLQLENWNSDNWWDNYCNRLLKWIDEGSSGDPPSVKQSEDEDHKVIGNEDGGCHGRFLDALKNIPD